MSEENPPAYQPEPQEPAPQSQQPPTDVPVQQPVAAVPAYPPSYAPGQPGHVLNQPGYVTGAYNSPLMSAALAQQQALAANVPPAQVCINNKIHCS